MKVKKLSKRIIASVLSMMLIIGCFAIPSTFVGAASETTVNIHYLREDGKYDDWDVWAWPSGGEGKAYAFGGTVDTNGAVASVTLEDAATSLGFIVRHPDWSVKDYEDDLFIDLSAVVSGTVDVYYKSGDPNFTTNYDNAVTGLKLKSAKATSKTEVTFELTIEPTDEADKSVENFSIKTLGGTDVAIASVTFNGNKGTLVLSDEIDYQLDYRISYKDTELSLTVPDYFSSEEFESQYTYDGDDLGATYTKEKTSFRVWAPTAQKIKLNIYDAGNGGTASQVIEMTADVKGTWVAAVEGDLNKKYYTYTAEFEGKTNEDIVDPYAKSVGVNGQRGQILDLTTTDPANWSSDSRHTYSSVTDMEIYEVHIRDFSIDEDSGITNKGKYLAFTETGTTNSNGTATGVDHLVDLGVTSVHILPSYDFGSVDETKLDTPQFNWGYDPVNYNAPEGSYSTDPYNGEVRVNEYKQMVQGLHNAGLGVIMDVVYNHTYNKNYCFNQLVPEYFYRPDSNGSGCGNDVASERTMVRKFIVDSVKYWASEYHLDGFRFDLMGLIDVDTMNAVRAAVDEIDPTIAIYGEGWTLDTKVTKDDTKLATQPNASLTPGIAYFSDNIRDSIKGHVFDSKEKGYANGNTAKRDDVLTSVQYTKAWSPSPLQAVNYVDCHDNLTLWDKIRTSNPDDSEEDQIRQNLLAAAIVQTAQGIPFMMSGEEFLRTKTNADGTFVSDSYASPDSVNKLDYSRIETYSNVYNYYKGLIAFRKDHPAFRLTTADAVSANFQTLLDNVEDGVIAYTLEGAASVEGETAERLLVVYNPLSASTNVTLPDGNWDIYINDTTAGTDVINSVSGTVEVPKISAMVLVRNGDAAVEPSDDSEEPSDTDDDNSTVQPADTSDDNDDNGNDDNDGTESVVEVSNDPVSTTQDTTVVQTGDTTNIAMILFIAVGAAFAGVIVYKKRKPQE